MKSTIESAVVAAVVGAVVGAICSGIVSSIVSKRTTIRLNEIQREQQLANDAYRALLLAREIRFWIETKAGNDHSSFERRAQSIRGYLVHFQMPDVEIPPDPTLDQGAAAVTFVNTVTGRLEMSNTRATAALLLGWNGLLFEDPDVPKLDEYAQKAGFPPRSNNEKTLEYLQRLMDKAEELLR